MMMFRMVIRRLHTSARPLCAETANNLTLLKSSLGLLQKCLKLEEELQMSNQTILSLLEQGVEAKEVELNGGQCLALAHPLCSPQRVFRSSLCRPPSRHKPVSSIAL